MHTQIYTPDISLGLRGLRLRRRRRCDGGGIYMKHVWKFLSKKQKYIFYALSFVASSSLLLVLVLVSAFGLAHVLSKKKKEKK